MVGRGEQLAALGQAFDPFNRMLLHAAVVMLLPAVQLATFDLLERVPPFNEDWEADPAPLPVAQLRQLIADADGLLIATPEYNGSIPGQLKNGLDWASRPHRNSALQDKPAAVISASPRATGAARAAAELRTVLTAAGASVIGTGFAVPRAFTQFTPDGQLADPELGRQLRAVTHELIQAAVSRHEAAWPAATAANAPRSVASRPEPSGNSTWKAVMATTSTSRQQTGIPAAGQYRLDPSRTTVTFRTRHLFGRGVVTGTMSATKGEVTLDPAVPRASVTVTLSAASWRTGTRARNRDIRSPRFLHAERYPDITFRAGRSATLTAGRG